MPGKLEPLRRVLSKPSLRPLRDLLVRTSWRLDPELAALGWNLDTVLFAQARRKPFLAWREYDRLHRLIRQVLSSDPEWRQGPEKSWEIARGPIDAVAHLSGERRLAVDLGAGSHFPESTGWLLWLECGFHQVICVEPTDGALGSESGALLDLVHWLLDRIVTGDALGARSASDPARMATLHKRALHGAPSDRAADPVRVERCTLEELLLDAGSVDLITSNAVFEQVDAPPSVLLECKRVLRPRGILHSVIDFRDHRWFTEPTVFEPLPSGTHGGAWADPATNGWRWHDWESEIRRLGGLELVSLTVRGIAHNVLDANAAQADIASAEIIVRRLGVSG